MRGFNNADFLLTSPMANVLYNKAAKDAPIFDFHCHLDPQEIWENRPFENITQVWLGGDHYKWRTMRMNGIGETYITGDGSDWEKFKAWAETVPNLIGNPLYHWTHMELKTYFGIDKLLGPDTAEEIWEECNAKLKTNDFKPRAFIKRSNVKFIGTTDDPVSSLEYHELLQNDASFDTKIAPTFRPDGAMFIEKPTFKEWLGKLTAVTGVDVVSLDDLFTALKVRIDFFAEKGCSASDHDVQKLVYREPTKQEVEAIFNKALKDDHLTEEELLSYRWYFLTEAGKMYAEKQWVMQLHMGAMRNNNTRMKEKIGPDTGFDSIGDQVSAYAISRFLDHLDQQGLLPRTILFNLNPNDNDILAGMMGNFYEEGIPGKIQFGSAWWFNDHIDGMIKQMKDLANVGLLSHFVGMLTDSRSLLSYVRHDYFRRILCNLVGEWANDGKVPYDENLLAPMIERIAYHNAQKYFLKR